MDCSCVLAATLTNSNSSERHVPDPARQQVINTLREAAILGDDEDGPFGIPRALLCDTGISNDNEEDPQDQSKEAGSRSESEEAGTPPINQDLIDVAGNVDEVDEEEGVHGKEGDKGNNSSSEDDATVLNSDDGNAEGPAEESAVQTNEAEEVDDVRDNGGDNESESETEDEAPIPLVVLLDVYPQPSATGLMSFIEDH